MPPCCTGAIKGIPYLRVANMCIRLRAAMKELPGLAN